MKNTNNPVRLLAEILGIVGVCEVVVMLILPLLSAQLSPVAEGLLDVSLLLLLSGPTVYWRCMAITRAAIAPRRGESTRNGGASIRFAVAMTAAAQVLGLVVTAGGVWWQQQGINHAAEVRFDRAVDRVEADVRRRLESGVWPDRYPRGLRRQYQRHPHRISRAGANPGHWQPVPRRARVWFCRAGATH
jgi:hypothetical protein